MTFVNTRKIISSTARAEIRRLKARMAVLLERKRVLESLIAEQNEKAKQPDKPDSE